MGGRTRERRRFRGPIARTTERLPEPWNHVVDWILTIGIAVAVVVLVKAYVVNPYKIPSSSMEPTFHCAGMPGCLGSSNDRVLANRFIYHVRKPHRGDVIVFDAPKAAALACSAGGTYVKRLVGLPGETIAGRGGRVLIDGKPLVEPYLTSSRGRTDVFGPVHLGAGQYFMMGDNRQMSCDSRRWGPITRDEMIGPVFFVYWPLSRIGFR
jgi:signal peptidase I